MTDRGDDFVDAGGSFGVRGLRRFDNAVAKVVTEKPNRHLLERADRRRNLRHNVGTPAVVLDHLLQAANLALDLAETRQIVLAA
jgi:hypothetical protein